MDYFKFPRIYHFSDSPGLQNDDKRHHQETVFEGLNVVGSIKLDGENTNVYPDGHVHARSMDSGPHPSREWIKRLSGDISYSIPQGWRICGENLYAKHSIHYKNLLTYFYLYTIFDKDNRVLSWDETSTWSELLGVAMVPCFYRGIYDKQKISAAFSSWKSKSLDEVEGYVIRWEESFSFEDFSKYYIKWVRAGHVQTDKLWMYQAVVPNILVSSIK